METLDVTLGGRSYPLTLSSEEVETVRAAAQAVEAQIAQLKSQYAITDRIDLMAMAALQIAVQARTVSPEPSLSAVPNEGTAPTWPADQVEDLLQRIHASLEG
ncbi:MAG: cell division protein ZapA [Bacteroidota bacterium]|nr:cell division protein ZapA [Bacteroidota bacterium]